MQKLEMIGMGSEASVYLVDIEGENYALKVPHDNVEINDITSRLEHPNIIRTYRRTDDGLLMEYFKGDSLDDYIKDNKVEAKRDKGSQKSYVSEVLGFIIQVGEALEYARQQGVRHHDLKPSNILVKEGLAKIIDFSESYTPDYVAPEILKGEVHEKSEVYSLGMILCEALTDRPIFADQVDLFLPREYKELRELGIAEGLSKVIGSMLYVDPNKRSSMQESVDSMKDLLYQIERKKD